MFLFSSLRPLLASTLFLLLAGSISAQTSLSAQRLADIALEEEKIYKKIAEDPEFYSADDLERHIGNLIGAYNAYLLDHPNNVNALILYGKLLRRVERYDEAFSAFLKADEVDPEIAVVKQQIGTHLAEGGNGKAALPFYLLAVELEPETAAYHFSLGTLLHEFRSVFIEEEIFTRDALEREMLKAFKQAASLEPEAFNLQMRLGEAYYDLTSPDWKSALLHWNELRKRFEAPLQAEILDLHRARVMGKLGRYEEAIALTETILNPSLQQSKAQVLEEIAQH